MKYTSIGEKITCIANIIAKSNIYPIFIIILALITILLITKKLKNKTGIILIAVTYISLFTTVIANNYKQLSKVFDNLSTNIFTNIYFPSTYTYLFILIIIDIITIKSLLNFKENKVYKRINIIYFLIMQFIFALTLETISKNKIDIFVKKSLFSNTNLIILLEISIIIFILWQLSIFIVYTTNKITEILTNKTPTNDIIPNIDKELVVENIENKVIKEEKRENISIINNEPKENNIDDNFNLNDLIFKTPPKENTEITKSSDELLDILLNNKLPILHEEEIEEPKKNYTLNDYKTFNKILKDIRETNNSNIISIDKELETKLLEKYTEEEYHLFKVMLKNYSN